jgi:hypothetical protein
MPFKDNADLPDAQVGWNGERAKRLGASVQILCPHLSGCTKVMLPNSMRTMARHNAKNYL